MLVLLQGGKSVIFPEYLVKYSSLILAMANPELCLSEFQNTIPTFVPAVLHTFSDYQKWYRFRTPIQNFEIFGIGILLFGFPIRLAPEL